MRGARGAEMVAWLLAERSSPDAKDNQGWTPLHVAAFVGDEPSTHLLLAAGVDPDVRTRHGETPLQVIQSTCWRGTAQSLCAQHGGVVKALQMASHGQHQAVTASSESG